MLASAPISSFAFRVSLVEWCGNCTSSSVTTYVFPSRSVSISVIKLLLSETVTWLIRGGIVLMESKMILGKSCWSCCGVLTDMESVFAIGLLPSRGVADRLVGLRLWCLPWFPLDSWFFCVRFLMHADS